MGFLMPTGDSDRSSVFGHSFAPRSRCPSTFGGALYSAAVSDTETKSQDARPQKVKVYLESRYRKLERGLPQTIFYCPECKGNRRKSRGCERCEGFGKLTKDSVQEMIGRKAIPLFRAKRGKFHGAGREDIDVLMLGRGRPFVYEVVDSRGPDADLTRLDEMIREEYAGRIELEPFRRVERERVPYWKESKFDKLYRVQVEFSGEVSPEVVRALAGKSFDIAQRTPTRVAHRRADLERHRHVSIQTVGECVDGTLSLDIRCLHGTYVKEWISSDDGRTTPSLTSVLGVPSKCAALDVLDILTDD
jgi:tRNA pseudouridine synthase 10